MQKIVTIHQPDFMPWLGFFYKLSKVDYFVLLDHVEMDVKNAGWIKRVKHLINEKAQWLTIPLKHPTKGYSLPIRDMVIDTSNSAYLKSYRIVHNAYSRHPFYREYGYLIEDYFNFQSNFISDRNFFLIKEILKILDINPLIIRSSEIEIYSNKSEMNAEIVKKVGGTTYYSGQGAIEYQDENHFNKLNIELQISDFDPLKLIYPQINRSDFTPGLSIIDAIMNIGATETKQLITS